MLLSFKKLSKWPKFVKCGEGHHFNGVFLVTKAITAYWKWDHQFSIRRYSRAKHRSCQPLYILLPLLIIILLHSIWSNHHGY